MDVALVRGKAPPENTMERQSSRVGLVARVKSARDMIRSSSARSLLRREPSKEGSERRLIKKASSSSEKKASSSERKAAKEGNTESRSSRESSQQAGLSASSCHVTAPERHRAAARQRVECVVLDLRDTSQDYQTCYPNFRQLRWRRHRPRYCCSGCLNQLMTT